MTDTTTTDTDDRVYWAGDTATVDLTDRIADVETHRENIDALVAALKAALDATDTDTADGSDELAIDDVIAAAPAETDLDRDAVEAMVTDYVDETGDIQPGRIDADARALDRHYGHLIAQFEHCIVDAPPNAPPPGQYPPPLQGWLTDTLDSLNHFGRVSLRDF